MSDDIVSTKGVIRVLEAHGVTVTPGTDGSFTLEKGDVVEVQFIGSRVSGRLLHRFRHRFDIPIHLLFRADDPPAGPRLVERKVASINPTDD